jgi:hypothetical protein
MKISKNALRLFNVTNINPENSISKPSSLVVFISGEQTKENNENVGLAVNNLRLKLVSTVGTKCAREKYTFRTYGTEN